MSCRPPFAVIGSRNLRILFEFVEADADGELEPIDLTLASTPPGFCQAWFKKPGRSLEMKLLTVSATPSSGEAFYLTEAGFLDEAGIWQAQGAAFIPGTGPGQGYFLSRIVEFEVLPHLRPFAPGPENIAPEVLELEVVAPDPIVA